MVKTESEDEYKGYINLYLSEEEMAEFYSKQQNNYGLYINEYVNIFNKDMERVDTLCWTGKSFRQ